MKPQSKKDQYTVRCENRKQTCDVLNYIDKDTDRSWSHWEYVTRIGDEDSDITENNQYEFPVISFEEWQRLPDVPKPEYDPKDVAFKNDVYCNSEFNSEKKILGYKLIKPEYKEAVIIICDFDSNKVDLILYKGGYNFTHKSHSWCKIKEAGVMHWFEEVYEKESITLKSGTILSEDDIAEVKEILKNK